MSPHKGTNTQKQRSQKPEKQSERQSERQNERQTGTRRSRIEFSENENDTVDSSSSPYTDINRQERPRTTNSSSSSNLGSSSSSSSSSSSNLGSSSSSGIGSSSSSSSSSSSVQGQRSNGNDTDRRASSSGSGSGSGINSGSGSGSKSGQGGEKRIINQNYFQVGSSDKNNGESVSKKPRGDIGNLFIKYVLTDGVRSTLRGIDADPLLYECMQRLQHEETSDPPHGWVEEMRLRKYNTRSCGFKADGSILRVDKKYLKYSSEILQNLFSHIQSRPQYDSNSTSSYHFYHRNSAGY